MRSRPMTVLLLAVTLAAIRSPGAAWAAPSAAAEAAPLAAQLAAAPALRLGMLHPLPHLCVGQEPGQRDLRVLRLAYGVALTPAERIAWPWYLAVEGRQIALREEGLFGPPRAGSDTAGSDTTGSGSPAAGSATVGSRAVGGGAGGLARWLESVQGRVPALSVVREVSGERRPAVGAAAYPGADPAADPAAHGGPSLPVLRVKAGAEDPWLASRLNGNALLPYREELGVARPCRSWPAGVEFLPGRGATEGGRVRYVLRRREGHGVPAFTLSGYGNAGALWADFGADRLDVALLDSGALRHDDVGGGAAAGGVWGVQAGTQQVILRLSPRWEAARTAEARRALSQAINRPALAGAAERGAFRAARAFLEPVLPEGRAGEAEALRWDSRLARKQWLALAGHDAEAREPSRRLRLAVLSHPLLEVFARRIAGQWQTTLDVVAVPELVDAERLLPAWNSGAYDALLDVADLDDGSLQDLWNSALGAGEGGGEPPTPAQLAVWEGRLRQDLPYLPLLTGIQTVLAHGAGAAERLRHVCPGCAHAAAPPSGDN